MKRKLAVVAVGGAFVIGAIAPAWAAQHGPPGPGSSHNGKCIGNPADRIGGC
jgi:hypothetical protein